MQIQTRRLILQVIVMSVAMMFLTGVSNAGDETQYYKDREKAENGTSDFNPAYFKEDNFSHIVVFIQVVEGNLRLSPKPAQIRTGKMPHHAKRSNAPFRVSYFADEKELGSYTGRDPFIIDSFDPDNGPKEGVITAMKNGIVEILLPNMPIQTIKIFRAQKETVEFDVAQKIKTANSAGLKR